MPLHSLGTMGINLAPTGDVTWRSMSFPCHVGMSLFRYGTCLSHSPEPSGSSPLSFVEKPLCAMPAKKRGAASNGSAAKAARRGHSNTEQWNTCWAQHLHQKFRAMEKKDEHPAQQILDLYGPTPAGAQNRVALRQKIFEVTGTQLPEITGKFCTDSSVPECYTLPLDAFVAARVTRKDDEGKEVIDLPRLQQWECWLKDILSAGYERGREKWKIKRGSHCANAVDIITGSVEQVKGFTRYSIIMWTLHHGIAYMETATESVPMEKFEADYNIFKTYPEC